MIEVLSNVTPVPEVYKVWLLAPEDVVLPVKYNVPAGTLTKSTTPLLTEDVAVPDVVEFPTVIAESCCQATEVPVPTEVNAYPAPG